MVQMGDVLCLIHMCMLKIEDIPETWTLIWNLSFSRSQLYCSNKLHCSAKAFHQMLEWIIQLQEHSAEAEEVWDADRDRLIPKLKYRTSISLQATQSLYKPYLQNLLYSQVQCHAGTGWGNLNATACKKKKKKQTWQRFQ